MKSAAHAIERTVAATARIAALAGLLGTCSGLAQAAEPEWFLHTGGLSHHFQETQAPNRQWREQHPGLGLERRTIDQNGWQVRWTGGVMQDSRGIWGGYAGSSYVHRWRADGGNELSAGAGAYAFYRSTSWKGNMTVVPALLPTASVGLLDNRLGLNVIYVPRIPALREAMPAVLYVQMAVRFQ